MRLVLQADDALVEYVLDLKFVFDTIRFSAVAG
jgi:hypothetical protein